MRISYLEKTKILITFFLATLLVLLLLFRDTDKEFLLLPILVVMAVSGMIYLGDNVYKVVVTNDYVFSVRAGGKKQCTVDLNKQVYFASFKTFDFIALPFLLISNEPFINDAFVGSGGHTLRDTYDKDKQILIFYSKKVRRRFPCNGWNAVKTEEGMPLLKNARSLKATIAAAVNIVSFVVFLLMGIFIYG